MADEDEKQKPVIYGSAGMAAAGMIPGARLVRKGNQNPKAETPAEDPPSAEEPEETPPELVAQEVPAPEPVSEPHGRKAVVSGQTEGGGFGPGLLQVFQRLDGVRLVAVCDEHGATVEQTRSSAAAPNGYARFTEMLEQESPDLVCLASEWSEGRCEQAKEALASGANVLCGSPFVTNLKEADELIELASANGSSIAVAGSLRCDPHLSRFHAEHGELIGDILQVLVIGDASGQTAGEDLLVNGLRLFDVARWFAGEVSFCTANITLDGFPTIAEDAHESETRKIGPLLGDTIHAEFVMESGIPVTYRSDARMASALGPCGIEFVGTSGRMRFFLGDEPALSLLNQAEPSTSNRTDSWQRWPETPGDYHVPVDGFTGQAGLNRLLVKDWTDSLDKDNEALASVENARKALEMAHGIWQAGVTMRRAYFPLVNRLHPLAEESR